MVRFLTDSGVAVRRLGSKMRTRHRPGLPRVALAGPPVYAVGAVAMVTYALHGLNGVLTRDLGVYSYAGQQAADGVPPYEGILNRAGPLAHVIPAIGVAHRASRRVRRRHHDAGAVPADRDGVHDRGLPAGAGRVPPDRLGLVTAATFLTVHGFIHYAANGPREKTPMTLFIACALWAVSTRRWFAAGLFVSLATLCLQIAFFTAFPAVLVGALAAGWRSTASVPWSAWPWAAPSLWSCLACGSP